ncbi:conserved hypothetical protein [Pediculus humanus corporis]|uniref:Uncharacterized protein n=1 Tax=Pediculus humanus subsp. corporis TaxID=121224 RepID=E0VN54_PEDHC|nr:uncharacterized protein Phum_PHUM328990 [Pediculus humanus corporis]EEB14820.1 conserved hypothetical protein [Pediculus humanus corporis]
MPVGGRVAGKIGYISNSSSGSYRSYTGINEEIIWTCIGMSIAIAVLITMALCYIAREKCRKRNEYYINA